MALVTWDGTRSAWIEAMEVPKFVLVTMEYETGRYWYLYEMPDRPFATHRTTQNPKSALMFWTYDEARKAWKSLVRSSPYFWAIRVRPGRRRV